LQRRKAIPSLQPSTFALVLAGAEGLASLDSSSTSSPDASEGFDFSDNIGVRIFHIITNYLGKRVNIDEMPPLASDLPLKSIYCRLLNAESADTTEFAMHMPFLLGCLPTLHV
jgi:hypothetical protein